MGSFTGGLTTPGTLLPTPNQNSNGNAAYSGGVGIAAGVVLCTGAASDSDSAASGTPGRGVGVEGPNNGQGDLAPNPGEIGLAVVGTSIIDQDFNRAVFAGAMNTDPLLTSSGDPTVLQFRITLQKPGFLRLSSVFASDEFPFFINQQFNDSFAILVKKEACSADFQNIALFKDPIDPNPKPFDLHAAKACGAPLFKQNQLAPSPSEFVGPPASGHAIQDSNGNYDTSVPYYDHEFGGFTMPLTRETPLPLSVGTYTIKIVVHDVGDASVDSALFIAQNSLKLYSLNPGDYNGKGVVDAADYVVWRHHQNQFPAGFYDGDGNGDCVVNNDDYNVWRAHFGEIGNADYAADFNRDGCVDQLDNAILQQYSGVLMKCASRFEGDATSDGAVNAQDAAVWQSESGSCSGGNSPHFAARMTANGAKTLSLADIPASPDVNGDGVVDEKDLAALDQIILGTDLSSYDDPNATIAPTKPVAESEPTLAEPAPFTR